MLLGFILPCLLLRYVSSNALISNPLSASSLAPQIRLWLTIVRVYKLYLLTYLIIKNNDDYVQYTISRLLKIVTMLGQCVICQVIVRS